MDFPKLFLRSSLLVLHFAFSSSRDTITINQTLHDGDFLISRENNFALGFFSTGSSSFRYLGIWYHKVREQTVVWVANRDDPIYGSSGVLSIDLYGNLVLHGYHNQKAPVWTTNVSVEVTDYCVAQLLDTGNLILVRDKSKSTVWESFDHPTDTMLPGMKLGLNRRTGMGRFPVSWRSADDPGTGNFSLQINPKGSPQVFIYWGIKYIWRSIAWPLKSYADISNVSFVNNQNETYVVYSVSDASVILRVILDYSGLLKKLIWHEKDGKWNEFWSVPKSPCDPYGHCGTYGICDPEFLSRRFECDCLPGYEPKSPRDWHILKDASGGCVRKRLESTSLCGHGEGFVKVANVKVPDTSAAVWVSTNMSPRDCEKNCRRNCSCSAYASIDIAGKETGCLTWYGKLMDTVQNREEGYDIYVRVDAVELAEIAQKWNGFLERKDMLAILVISVVSAWFVIILFTYLWLKKKKKRVRNKWSKRWLDTIGNAYYKETSVENQVEANKLGQGGFGAVYKGKLSNGKEVAVKRLLKDSGQGIDEFKNEVLLIAKLQHQNLVKLIGCCIQGEEPMLVYEYMPNKSLDSFLFNETGRSILDWRKRFDIIVGIARGILYIHQDSRLRIIHRDLKTSNILLDEEMNPKISDFGLARIFEGDQTHEKTNRIVGTFGYMSPEYVVFGKFSTKSDVFSFGIILLEIVAGKKNNSFCQEDSYPSMIGKIWHLWREERAWEIVDSLLKHSCSPDEVLRCIQVGLLCVQEDVMERPTMSAIVLMLNSEISLPSPKQPAFTFRKSSIISSSSLKPKEGFCSVDEETITEVVCR
ncbi:G-type lectin S-receptor-like serine/threonine-protein kinase At1g11410 isoform X2 [Hevea brasiliensis]|uniref:G-type lectin S-receptor-like serine/threonine-protein kinase At1g11410 isoform X2 n=1 Tax=Hevea brasiliensis TaxID=3981 RepID=UPI0025E2069E|nr:G-type lectin S-receptor-like serine/threonine-protein kinase At1g11410 isoform X2 [Hevea brasiliensis]